MKKLILLVVLFFFQTNIFSQNVADYSEIITKVSKLYEKDSLVLYDQLRNEIYEYELYLLKNDQNNPESEILKYLKIKYKELKKIYRKTDKKKLSEYYITQTSNNLKEKNIAIMATPIISRDGKSALIFGRYSCGSFCGQTTIFYFNKKDAHWLLHDFKELK